MSIEGYYREKLSNAVSCLVGLGDIKERLQNAFISMITVSAGKFPTEELRDQFSNIYSSATMVKDADPEIGYLSATIGAMTEDDAGALAQKILDIHNAMLRRAKDPYDLD